jgi:RNA polymerase sigma factor (sigma-70 family)
VPRRSARPETTPALPVHAPAPPVIIPIPPAVSPRKLALVPRRAASGRASGAASGQDAACPDADALIVAHMDLVASIARRVHRSLPDQFDLADLAGEGYLALCKAARRYDPANHGGAPFSSYARMVIRGGIIESVRRKRWTEQTRPSIDAHAEFDGHEDVDPRHATEAARAMDRLAHANPAPVSIDAARMRAKLADAAQYLVPLERQVLQLVYSNEQPPIRTVAARLGLSVADCACLHAKAVASLRARLTGAAFPRAA